MNFRMENSSFRIAGNQDQPLLKRARKPVDKDFGDVATIKRKNVVPREKKITSITSMDFSTNSGVVLLLPSVALSKYDKAPQLRLSRDQLMCRGHEVIMCSL